MNHEAEKEAAIKEGTILSPTGSPIRKLCKESLEKGNLVKAVVHHIDVDTELVKKSKEETTLPTVTTYFFKL